MSDHLHTRRDLLGMMLLAPVLGQLHGCESDKSSETNTRDAQPGADLGTHHDAAQDAALPDAALPDAALPDAALPDAALPDAALPDAALPDAGADLCAPTGSDAEGPFFERGAPERERLAAEEEPGERLVISGQVRAQECSGISGATIDVWQADAEGTYHGAGDDWRLRGRVTADADGAYRFETIMPGRYALEEGLRPAHIHVMVSHPDFVGLTTQIYFSGDPSLAPNDPCTISCDSGDEDRIIDLAEAKDGQLHGVFDIVLARR